MGEICTAIGITQPVGYGVCVVGLWAAQKYIVPKLKPKAMTLWQKIKERFK